MTTTWPSIPDPSPGTLHVFPQGASFKSLGALAAKADPGSEIYRKVEEQLRCIANFSFFSMPNLAQPNVPLMSNGKLIGVEVHEMLHRFEIREYQTPTGLRVTNTIGQPAAQVHMTWRPIPDDFVARPDAEIPQTLLDPARSQRFMMRDGRFTIDDQGKSGFKGFGTGRTFPVMVSGKPQLRIAAVVDVVEGFGAFKGHEGMLVVNGHIKPPDGLALNILLRVTDPSGQFQSGTRLPALRPIQGPEHEDLYLVFLGEGDPKAPLRIETTPEGEMQGAVGPQRMRLIGITFNVRGSSGICSKSEIGAIVGHMNAKAWFDPGQGKPPYAFQTTKGTFVFRDGNGSVIGTLDADMVEGRALPTQIHGAPLPAYRVGGMAPVTRGTGLFKNTKAIFTINSLISLVPDVVSGLFVLHLSSPGSALRSALGANSLNIGRPRIS